MTPAIAVKDLRYRYHDGKEALNGISFTVKEGECVGLIGPNGAGKSTILQHLNGILPETLGGNPSVTILGQAVSPATLPEIRRNVGLLFQDPDDQLFCPSVYEDVAFGPEQFGLPTSEIVERVSKALAQVGLLGFEKRSPHHLSGGEKQRVCLAGILACSPRVLALDEPTSDLDPRGKRELKNILKQITATKIIASHDLELVVTLCSRVIVVDAGIVVADGPTVQLLSDETFMLAHGLEKPHSLQHRHPHN
ncbi:MAG TPA: cobalt ABC transporter ATP-binding protein [Bacteroidetes bacterium]|nr:cobalt ABC transporter ATP-binding protein [Bacteroidota bacterium]